MKRAALVLFSFLAVASTALAQVVPAGNPVVYAHHHLNVTDVEAQKKFFAGALGGTVTKFGPGEIVKFPGVLVMFRAQKPTGGTKGTTMNHIGFSVPNLRATVDKVSAAGYPIVTQAEVASDVKVSNGIGVAPSGANIAFVMGPDDIKVELVEVKAQTQPVALHHLHVFGQQNKEMRAWYAKMFGAKPRDPQGSVFVSADLPGVAMNFTPSDTPVVGTAGRSLDHIGFEVKNLEAFTKNLEAQGIKLNVAYRNVPAINTSIAFFTDPWGTYIELTEGLDKVQ
jgi:catechol 2,3-dioxygenase-like lactoylglutathione lyase family enzyme